MLENALRNGFLQRRGGERGRGLPGTSTRRCRSRGILAASMSNLATRTLAAVGLEFGAVQLRGGASRTGPDEITEWTI